MPPQLRAEPETPEIADRSGDTVPGELSPAAGVDRRRFALDLTGPTRVAMVGAGYIADYHLEVLAGRPDIQPNVQVVAVCDTDLGRAESAAARFKVPHAVDSVDALAGLGVQVAHVLVPPDLHVLVTRRLLALGIGVLVEKPLALSERRRARPAAPGRRPGPAARREPQQRLPPRLRPPAGSGAGGPRRPRRARPGLPLGAARPARGGRLLSTGCSARRATSSSSRRPTRCPRSTP